jgi:oleate hydratase
MRRAIRRMDTRCVAGDRPLPAPGTSENLVFISQFIEISEDVVFTVEYSVCVAQIAVYQLPGIDLEIPPILHHDKSLKVEFDAVIKAF